VAEANKFVVREPSWQGWLAPNDPKENYSVTIAARTAKGTELGLLQHYLVVD